MYKYLSLFLISLFALNILHSETGSSKNKISSFDYIILQPALEYSKTKDVSLLNAEMLKYPYLKKNGHYYVDVLIEVNDNNSVNDVLTEGAIIKASSGNIIAASIPIEMILQTLENENVIKLESSKLYHNILDKSVPNIKADNLRKGINLDYPVTGKGVIVGVFDSGIDFTHPDFNDNGGSRILYLWDMSDKTNTNSPAGFDWGREYSKSEIDNNPENVLEKDINSANGHGTHVAGIAAGGGKANASFVGVAPESDIIFVKGVRNDDKSSFSDADIIAGCQYILNKAEVLKKPAVINLSLGTPIGPHDGTDLLSRALSNMVGKGKIIVAGAGNDGSMPIHSGGNLDGLEYSETLIIPINLCEIFDNFCPDIPNFFMTAGDIWYSKNAIDTVFVGVYGVGETGLELLAEKYLTVGNLITDFPLVKGDTVLGLITINATQTSANDNGDGEVFIYIHNGGVENIKISNFIWSIRTVGQKAGTIDMWSGIPLPEGSPVITNRGKPFQGNNIMTIGAPATGKKIISVASYVTKNEWIDINDETQNYPASIDDISSFSSRGPSRDGRILPNISAPGEVIFSALASNLSLGDGVFASQILKGGFYQGLQGTSMAAPHVSGTVALMLQVNPSLDYDDVLSILHKTAIKDEFTGDTPNTTWGAGKLDAYAAVKQALKATDVNDFAIFGGGIKIYPNPASESISIELNNSQGNNEITLYNFLGKKVSSSVVNVSDKNSMTTLNLMDLPAGTYFINFSGTNQVYPFVIKR